MFIWLKYHLLKNLNTEMETSASSILISLTFYSKKKLWFYNLQKKGE